MINVCDNTKKITRVPQSLVQPGYPVRGFNWMYPCDPYHMNHVSGSVIRCLASQGIFQISSPSGSIWSTPAGSRRGNGSLALDTRPLVQSGRPVRGFNRISSLHIRPLVQSGRPVRGFNRIFSPERITRVPPSLGSIWSPSPRVQSDVSV